jgi:hypothetical protein
VRGVALEGGSSATGSSKALKAFGKDSEEEPEEVQMHTDALALVAITKETLSGASRIVKVKEAGGEIDDCSRNNSERLLLDSRMLETSSMLDKADDSKIPCVGHNVWYYVLFQDLSNVLLLSVSSGMILSVSIFKLTCLQLGKAQTSLVCYLFH